MADMNMGDMKDQAKEKAEDMKQGVGEMRERMEEKMHSDDRERSANEE